MSPRGDVHSLPIASAGQGKALLPRPCTPSSTRQFLYGHRSVPHFKGTAKHLLRHTCVLKSGGDSAHHSPLSMSRSLINTKWLPDEPFCSGLLKVCSQGCSGCHPSVASTRGS